MKIKAVTLSETTQVFADPKTLLHKPGIWFLMLRIKHRFIGFFKSVITKKGRFYGR